MHPSELYCQLRVVERDQNGSRVVVHLGLDERSVTVADVTMEDFAEDVGKAAAFAFKQFKQCEVVRVKPVLIRSVADEKQDTYEGHPRSPADELYRVQDRFEEP